jgi:hypothetical protein
MNKFLFFNKLLVGIILIAVTCSGCYKTAPISTPEFQVALSDQKRIHEAIRTALIKRKWVVLKNEPSAIEARYTRGNEHSAHIRITHSGNTVRITHVDSQELLYSNTDGAPVIHSWYNTWVNNLERDIQVEVGALL